MPEALSLRGAHEHNLRHVDLDVPLGLWTAVVGPSGSGKTSLVVDTIVREGQRRFLGGLSARARQFYGKLGRAALDDVRGLPATIVVGQQTATDSSRSTVGTLSGALDLLRLLFAREGVDPGGVELSRSHFSFNHALGACEACGGLGLVDEVSVERIVADPSRSIRDGALRPTLKNGYTVYSQVTLEVMDQICRAHGFDVDTPWKDLADEQRDVVLYGTRALKVPFGKHSIESRMRWEGITARPREEGYYRGLVPVMRETLERNRSPNILRFVETAACGSCGGSRLSRAGRETKVGERRLPELLALPVRELRPRSPTCRTRRCGRRCDRGSSCASSGWSASAWRTSRSIDRAERCRAARGSVAARRAAHRRARPTAGRPRRADARPAPFGPGGDARGAGRAARAGQHARRRRARPRHGAPRRPPGPPRAGRGRGGGAGGRQRTAACR